MMHWHLVFPLLSSVLYVLGVLLIKRAAPYRVGILRTTFVSNLVTALVFLLLLPMGSSSGLWPPLWQPALVALLFIAAQALTFLALEIGDVSIATPALGFKTIYVAWFTTILLQTAVPWQLWAAAALTVGAIVLLNFSGHHARRPGPTIFFSLFAAAGYGMFDVLVQKWAPIAGPGRFLPLMFGFAAVLSAGFIPWFPAPLTALPKPAWKPLAAGSIFIALQSLSLVTAIAIFGDATAINVVYSSRGMWSVLAIWLVGHWFANTEQHLAPMLLRLRLLGALLMTSAIIIALLR